MNLLLKYLKSKPSEIKYVYNILERTLQCSTKYLNNYYEIN